VRHPTLATAFLLVLHAGLAAGSPAAKPPPIDVPAGYEYRSIHGFNILASQETVRRPRDRFGRTPLDVIELELGDLKRVVHPYIFGVLQNVPVWVEWDLHDPRTPAIARYFSADAAWMTQHGLDPRLAGSIQIMSTKRIGELRVPGTSFQQIITLHELAHAVHHRLLGMSRPDVKAAFQQAVERKLYDEVIDRDGHHGRAYARTNEAEYFAELSCAFLDTCQYYPFTYEDLKQHDPVGFKLMERVWKHPEQFEGMVAAGTKVGRPRPAPAAASRPDVFAERDALLKLDRLRPSLKDAAKKGQARDELRELVRSYPATTAAAEAKKLLDGLK
jgi:hypothetical protein